MNIFTHIGISSAILNYFEINSGIKLDRKAFKYGSIKPDIDYKLSAIPHYKRNVMDFVVSEIKNLLKMEINKKCSEEFSEKLGMITHYLSDFFCFAHSEYFKGSILEHYFYEFRLLVYCKINRIKINENLICKFTKIGPDYYSICRYIEKMQNDYLKSKSRFSLSLDIWYTMEVTISFCISAINACLAEEIYANPQYNTKSRLESA